MHSNVWKVSTSIILPRYFCRGQRAFESVWIPQMWVGQVILNAAMDIMLWIDCVQLLAVILQRAMQYNVTSLSRQMKTDLTKLLVQVTSIYITQSSVKLIVVIHWSAKLDVLITEFAKRAIWGRCKHIAAIKPIPISIPSLYIFSYISKKARAKQLHAHQLAYTTGFTPLMRATMSSLAMYSMTFFEDSDLMYSIRASGDSHAAHAM